MTMMEGTVSSDEFPDPVAEGDPAFDTRVSHQARVYNYLLGGKDHYAADRDYAEAMTAVYPGLAATARVNRDFLARAVRFLAREAGLSQFLDIGTGIPAVGSTHEVAQEVRPDARIVYADNDPVVLSHARALLISREPGSTDYLHADLREPGSILEQAAKTLDFSKPLGLLLIAILHAIPDSDDPHRIVATLVDALPSGSYLALSHSGSDLLSPEVKASMLGITSEKSRHQYSNRTRAEIARFFDGLDLVDPGLVQAKDWRPAPSDQPITHDTFLWVGLARKRLCAG
jgi:hypothetical protein